MPPIYLAWPAVLPVVLLLVVRLVWKRGLRSFSSLAAE